MTESDHSPLAAAKPDAQPDAQLEVERSRRKRRLIWAAVLIVLALAIVLTPPLINANRLSHRIAATMSQSLGRPVHLDNVTLHVLPTPGFTLQNLVVSEDPAFGAEPVIRAETVEASVRPSSLWRRHLEFGTVHFVDPSVNLVRRADGRWNLETILLHAAQEEAAPTAQKTAGPTPRFPYIEATNARVNVKVGDEKKPFALTEADFALWLPSPQQWRLRMEAKPTRTDTNVSDTGLLTLEATLDRAGKLSDVPVDITAAWRRAPLGEASHMLSGHDMGWRGDVETTAAAHGTLGNATFTTTLKLNNVRRSDFIPVGTISLNVDCSGHLSMTAATITEPACTLPVGEGSLPDGHAGVIAATAGSLDLATLHAEDPHLGMTNVPNDWLLQWAKLFSQRIPATTTLVGSTSGSVALAVDGPSSGRLQGEFHTAKEPDSTKSADAKATPRVEARNIAVTLANGTLTLSPINIAPPEKSPLLLGGSVTTQLYTLQVSGTATPQELASLRDVLPPLADGADQSLPALTVTTTAPIKIDMVCTRAWGSQQTCVAMRAPEVPTKKPRRR